MLLAAEQLTIPHEILSIFFFSQYMDAIAVKGGVQKEMQI